MKLTPVRIELNPMMNAASVIGMTELGEPTRVGRLKFKQPIAPGDALRLTLEREDRPDDAPRVHFRIDRDDGPCTVGVMTFATPAAPVG